MPYAIFGGGGAIGADKGGIYTGGQVIFVDPAHPGAVDDTDVTTPFITIQQAITAAVADGMATADPRQILIATGTYTEDITLADGATLVGLGTNNVGYAVGLVPFAFAVTKIIGTVTWAAAGRAQLVNLMVTPAAGRALYISAQVAFLEARNCQFTGAVAPALEAVEVTTLSFTDCSFVRADSAAGCVIFSTSGGTGVVGAAFQSCTIYSNGGIALHAKDGTASHLMDCIVLGLVTLETDGTVHVYGGQLNGNTTPNSGVGSAVASVGSGGILGLWGVAIITAADPCISGAGTVLLGGVTKDTLAGQISPTTLTLRPAVVGTLGVGRWSPAEGGVQAWKRHTGGAAGLTDVQRTTGAVSTSDDTPTEVDLVAAGGGWPLAASTAAWVTLKAVGRERSSGSVRVVQMQAAMVLCTGGGFTTLGAGSPSNTFYDDDASGMTAVLGASGASGTATVTVTGLGSTTVDWAAVVEIQPVGDAS